MFKITQFDLGWLIGLIEGDGTFTFDGKNRVVALKITDLDVAERFARLLNTTVNGPYHYEDSQIGPKPYYMTKISGRRAVEFMASTAQYFGQRRQAKIRELLGNQLSIDSEAMASEANISVIQMSLPISPKSARGRPVQLRQCLE